MEQEKKTAGMPCPPCKSAPFSRAVKPAAQENAVQEAAAPLGAPGQYGGSAVGRTEKTPGFTGVDAAFACGFLAVGWLFWELQLWSGWRWFGNAGTGTALFTALFAGAVLAYVYLAKLRPPRESWFWLAVLLCLGLGYALPYGGGLLGAVHYGALLFTAGYWTLSATGRLLKSGKTSNWLPLDVLNVLFVLPWGNFMRLPATFVFGLKGLGRRVRAARSEPGERSRGKRLLGVLGGVALALLCLCFVLPLLMAADDGFASLLSGFVGRLAAWFSGWRDSWTEFVVKVFFALPTALYLYGLVYGAVRGRRACVYDKKEVCAVQRGLRFAPRSTVLTALFVLCAVYLLFISMQAKYLFGAFWGALPEGFSYSEYARQGFFELCRVAAINIVILLAANVMSRAQAAENCLLRVCNTALSALTLLLLATAAAKMALYIAAYGLTVKRVLASVFLVWMACVFVCVILRQFRTVALVRVAVFLGAVLFALLCVLPVGDGISTYNAARVQAGTLDPDVMEQELRPLV